MTRGKWISRGRREFLGWAGAGIAAMAAGAPGRGAQAAEPNQQGAEALKIIDFHNHYLGHAFTSRAGSMAPPAMRAYWEGVNGNLARESALMASIEAAQITARVVNTPLEFVQPAGGESLPETAQRINDQLAELVGRNPGRLYGLATVDAYSGETGARELTRAVRELGLRGVFVEAARKDMFLDAPEARPTLAAAASLGVPVFVHPITDPELHKRFSKFGRLGITLNRSTINSAALFALLESGTFDELPGLRVVVTTLALGGVLLAGGFGEGHRLRQDAPALTRRHVYIDTMGLHPVLIRSAVDLLGADHVLVGTDWPIFVENSVPERLERALSACGLTAAQQQMIASGNALKLLNLT
jgi:predicted TIM-barrel fold metal-dependent hydrolase